MGEGIKRTKMEEGREGEQGELEGQEEDQLSGSCSRGDARHCSMAFIGRITCRIIRHLFAKAGRSLIQTKTCEAGEPDAEFDCTKHTVC